MENDNSNPPSEPPAAPPADPAWSEVAHAGDHSAERTRCLGVVIAEIARGAHAGVPATSSVMVILERIAAAIRNG